MNLPRVMPNRRGQHSAMWRCWVLSVVTLAMPIAARAQFDRNDTAALQSQLYQLRQDVQALRDQSSRGGGGYIGGGSDIAGQLLSRVQAMEEQLRQLRGQIDETRNQASRRENELSKRLDDLSFQLNFQKQSSASPSPFPAQPQPQAREVAPRPAPEPFRPPPDLSSRIVTAMPQPVVIPPPPPVPPAAANSFTFNQIPQPMREVKPAPVPVPVPKPAPKPVEPAAARPQVDAAPAPAVADPDGKRTPELALQEGHAALARRDYQAAERSAKEVMSNRTSPRAYDGQFLLAQALVGEKQFAQASIAFDDAYHRSPKGRHAQDALLGLAGALTAINEKRAACETLGRLRMEFPQVRADLQDTITKTNDRAGCGH